MTSFSETPPLRLLCMQATNPPTLFCLNNYGTHNAPQYMLHTRPVGLGANVHTLAACDWQSSWFAMVKINRSLNLHLAPPSFHPKLRPHDLCFLALTPWHLTCACEKINMSRPKRPPLIEAPETQRGGRAHHSEGPVWLAACLAIGCVGQREQSRRQTPDSQESRVRGEAAEHRRWEFAQESPLCRVTEAQMEQGEKERVRERGCNTTNAHLQRKRERAGLGRVAQRRHTIRDSCCETHFLHSHQHSSLIPGNECVMWFIESHCVTLPHLLRHDSRSLDWD